MDDYDIVDNDDREIVLDVVGYSFVPVKSPRGKVVAPALAVWVSEFPVDDLLIPPMLQSDSSRPVYYISGVSSFQSTSDVAVKVSTQIAHSHFEELYSGQLEQLEDNQELELSSEEYTDFCNTAMSLYLPAHIIAMVYALSKTEEEFPIVIYEGEPPAGVAYTPHTNMVQSKALVVFPPYELALINGELQEAFSDITSPSYRSPLYPVSYDEVVKTSQNEDVVEPHVRQAQGMLFVLAKRISEDDALAFDFLIRLTRWIELAITLQEDPDNEVLAKDFEGKSSAFFTGDSRKTMDFVNTFAQLIRTTFLQTIPSEYHHAVEELENSPIPDEKRDDNLEFAFNDIIDRMFQEDEELALLDSTDAFDASLDYIPVGNEDLDRIANPFRQGFPSHLAKIEEYFYEREDEDTQPKELLTKDLLNEYVVESLVNEGYPLHEILIAEVLVSVARAKAASDIINKRGNTTVNPTWNMSQWISWQGDSTIWELRALTKYVATYDIAALVELMKYTPDNTTAQYKPYLLLVLHHLAHILDDEGWTLGNLHQRLYSLDINPPWMINVRNLFASMITRLEDLPEEMTEEDYETDCPFGDIAEGVVEDNSDDLEQIMNTTSNAVPVLADVYATSQGVTPMDEAWGDMRVEYVKKFLNETSKGVSK